MQYQLSRIVAGPFLNTIWRPRVTGEENIPSSGGAILAANHLSVIDSVFLPLMVDRPVTFSASAKYFTASGLPARLLAAYLKATNQLRMDMERPRSAQDTLEAALALLREGKLFGIYPEGTRSPDGRLYRGRPGVGWLALKSGLPVIPVVAAVLAIRSWEHGMASQMVVTIGEILAEIMAVEPGYGFRAPLSLVGPFPSGAPAIFVDQMARFGHPCEIVGCVGNDDFGHLNLERLRADGVDLSAVFIREEAATGSAFVRYRPDGGRDYSSSTSGTAPMAP